MNTLNQKAAIISRRNSTTRYATAKLFSAKGATVIVIGRSASAINKVAPELKGSGYNTDQVYFQATDKTSRDIKLPLNTEKVVGFSKLSGYQILLKRFTRAEEIARLAGFPGSYNSSVIAGAEIITAGALIINLVLN